MAKHLDEQKISWVGCECRADNKKALEAEILNAFSDSTRNSTPLDGAANGAVNGAELKPTHVMSFIGRTHGVTDKGTEHEKAWTTIDYLEQKDKTGKKESKLKENVRDNLYAPLLLTMLCKKHGIHFTYLGTGCIFKFEEESGHPFGDDSTGFTEESEPNFFGSSYSIVKGFTDQMMHVMDEILFDGDDKNGGVLNLRIRMPITGKMEPRNFITKIVNYEYICSVPNSMTVLDGENGLLKHALDLARRKVTGTVNLTNPGVISHNDILEMYKDVVRDGDFAWKNFSQEEQLKILAADRSNNCMDTERLKKLCPGVMTIQEAVKDCLARMRVNEDAKQQ